MGGTVLKVYVLEGIIPYEGTALMGAYTSEAAAAAAKEIFVMQCIPPNHRKGYDEYQITEVELDQPAVSYF